MTSVTCVCGRRLNYTWTLPRRYSHVGGEEGLDHAPRPRQSTHASQMRRGPSYVQQDEVDEKRRKELLDLAICPPGTCEHASCEDRYLRMMGLRHKPKVYNPLTSATE